MNYSDRKSIRLPGYDYSNGGYYFVTICTQNRQYLFGSITDNKMVLNNFGNIIKNVWNTLPKHHPVGLGTFQTMPNHIHFIIQITRNDSGIARNAPTGFGHVIAGSLPSIIRSFKSETTKQIRKLKNCHNLPVWQRNYYEHIIRNELELNKIREYIKSNPLMWERDRNNPTSLRI